ncbi:Ig domain-containing protein [Streptomyces sp. WAC05950]|uniref:Ig domain-containing protein n=1 Tax=Streptomyces sp. WAC05950 TaxID=2487419 RepID=UPI0011E4D238|nr:Ig domain-containing protein [Streptomyces sp. WAC05950]
MPYRPKIASAEAAANSRPSSESPAWKTTGLPWGLTLDSTSGRITGRPWGSGTSRITATVTDSTGATAGTAFALTLNWF